MMEVHVYGKAVKQFIWDAEASQNLSSLVWFGSVIHVLIGFQLLISNWRFTA